MQGDHARSEAEDARSHRKHDNQGVPKSVHLQEHAASEGAAGADQSIAKTITLLRDQVDELQIEIGEHKSWLKTPSNLIALAALLVSLGLGIFTLYDQKVGRSQDDLKDKKDELSIILEKVIDARGQAIELAPRLPSTEKIAQDILINTSRRILLERAQAIVSDLEDQASINSLIFLGYELQLDSNFRGAEAYYLQAKRKLDAMSTLDRSNNFVIELTVLNSLGILYMIPSTGIQDVIKGREFWQTSIDTAEQRDDEYSLYILGYTYQTWSSAEYGINSIADAAEYLDQAKQAYEKMNPLNPLRQQQLAIVQQILEFYKQPGAAVPATSIVGQWEVSFPEARQWHGRAIVTPDETGREPFFSVDIFDRATGSLMRKYQGKAIALSASTIRVDWQGLQFAQQFGQPVMVAGSTILTSADESKYVGSDNVLGLAPLNIVLLKSGR
jgi:hypothetical protein